MSETYERLLNVSRAELVTFKVNTEIRLEELLDADLLGEKQRAEIIQAVLKDEDESDSEAAG